MELQAGCLGTGPSVPAPSSSTGALPSARAAHGPCRAASASTCWCLNASATPRRTGLGWAAGMATHLSTSVDGCHRGGQHRALTGSQISGNITTKAKALGSRHTCKVPTKDQVQVTGPSSVVLCSPCCSRDLFDNCT